MRTTTTRSKSLKTRNDNELNLDNKDLNVFGNPKKTVVSFQVNYSLWKHFDEVVENEYGRYKKSLIIEDLIKKYLAKKEK